MDDFLDENVKALEEILVVAKESFQKNGVPKEIVDDLRRVVDAFDRLKALQVYRDNYEFLKGLEGKGR